MISETGVNATAVGQCMPEAAADAGEVSLLSCPKTPQRPFRLFAHLQGLDLRDKPPLAGRAIRPAVGIAAVSLSYPGIADVALSCPKTPPRPGVGIALEAELAANAEMSARLAAITSAVRIADQ